MKSPEQFLEWIRNKISFKCKLAFISAFIIGMAVHMPIMLSDIPNHDGLSSMYFDQNMITSGRWFLMVACGFSSFFTVPWFIGILSMVFLGLAAAALCSFLELENNFSIVLVSGLLVTFPSIASNFAYIFTMDGYMLGVLLAVLAVLFVKKVKNGYIYGGICLAFSMGIYQAYLPMTIILSIYGCIMICMEGAEIKKKISSILKYLYMGVIGVALYYVILKILLFVQGKELDTYQGISGMGGTSVFQGGLLATLKGLYSDFFTFTFRGGILWNNIISGLAFILLAAVFVYAIVRVIINRKLWKNPWIFVIMGLLVVILPVAFNIMLVISPNVTYHLLMRYQWILIPILMIAFCDKCNVSAMRWGAVCTALVITFNYTLVDNIGYTNLERRYEKTYAYAVRLLDRIEQTPGYYQGIPIALVGVVGDAEYPVTDITLDVTGGMIGISGDVLLYTSANYSAFMTNYLGATLNFMTPDEMKDIYYSEEYIEMKSFPDEGSTKVVDGILYVKTENSERD